MDRLIYIAMNGAKHTLEQQAMVANNLANVSTTGFKAQMAAFRARAGGGAEVAKTRAFVVEHHARRRLHAGPLDADRPRARCRGQRPGLDRGAGADGREAYTRDGGLQISANGVLQTRSGLNVLGEGGPITIPPNSTRHDRRGRHRFRDSDRQHRPMSVSIVGQIKLVNPPEADLERGDDGLFRQRNGMPAPPDPNVQAHRRRAGRQQREHGADAGRHDRSGAPVRHPDQAADQTTPDEPMLSLGHGEPAATNLRSP